MITNERQLRMTKAEIRRFDDAAGKAQRDGAPPGVDHRIHQAMIEGLESEAAALRADVAAYQELRSGKVRSRRLSSLLELPIALIETRIARRLTQRQLADRLGVAEQQVQRYEATRYAGVGLERLQAVAQALGIRLRGIDFDPPTKPASRQPSTGSRSTGGRTSGRSRAASGTTRTATAKAVGSGTTASAKKQTQAKSKSKAPAKSAKKAATTTKKASAKAKTSPRTTARSTSSARSSSRQSARSSSSRSVR